MSKTFIFIFNALLYAFKYDEQSITNFYMDKIISFCHDRF